MDAIKNKVLTTILLILWGSISLSAQLIFIEAESFGDRGGWVIDQQSMDQMGSPYLLAHGLGVPVENATTLIRVPEEGEYRVWVRTRNWVAPWGVPGTPGKFQLLFNQQPLKTTFGTEGAEWHWQDGGTVHINKEKVEIAINDMTGFDGRCDAIVLTKDLKFIPPNEKESLAQFRSVHLNLRETPEVAGTFDLVVVGGGMAGITTAISAARLGCKVALIQNRPVLGGNNSSEVRVGLSGLIFQQPYPNLGKLVDEIGSVGHWTLWEAKRNPESERSKKILEVIEKNPEKKIHNAGPQSNYGDDKKQRMVEAEENIELFLNTHVFEAEKSGDKIISVKGKNIVTGEEIIYKGQLFADCTGDGNLGLLAGADFRMGRESRAETGEPSAPENADNLVMGTSVQWFAEKLDKPSLFPECPWAVQFTEETAQHLTRGDWDWETGFYWDQVEDIEYIRDYGLRAVFGNWSYLKNESKEKEKYNEYQLKWVAYIGGKRESRRLLGDVILKEQYLSVLKMNNSLNERVLELYTLYNLSRTLSASLQVSDLFNFVVGLIGEALNVDQYCLMFVDKELLKLQIRASHGMPEEILNHGEMKVSEGVSGRVVSSGQPLLINDISIEKDFFYFPHSGIQEGSYLGIPLKNLNGSVMGVLNVHKPVANGFSQSDYRLFTAVAENVAIAINNALTFQQTQELIRKDELTGLYNRRYFFERLDREIYRCRRYDRTISLLMIDIDHFKEYNDNFGHLRGDQALKKVARVLESNLRQIDVVCRYGGEEFLVLLPETSKDKAAIVGEKLRKAVEVVDFNKDIPRLSSCSLTITIGVSGVPDDANEAILALDMADKALYLGKARGRNQVCTTVLTDEAE